MSYALQELCDLKWQVIQAWFACMSSGEAFARDWFAARQIEIVDAEIDQEFGAIDFVVSRGGSLCRFAIDRVCY